MWESVSTLTAIGTYGLYIAFGAGIVGACAGTIGAIASNRANDIIVRESGERIAEAQARGQQALADAGLANKAAAAAGEKAAAANERIAEANAKIAAANERAARFELEAEKARLETERFKKELSWRSVSQSQGDEIVRLLSGLNTPVWFQWLSSDNETWHFSGLIANVLNSCGFDLQVTQFTTAPGMIGLRVSPNGDGPKILRALQQVGIEASTHPEYPTGSSEGKVVVSVGSKSNPNLR